MYYITANNFFKLQTSIKHWRYQKSEDEAEVSTQNNALKAEDVTCCFLHSEPGLDDGLLHFKKIDNHLLGTWKTKTAKS